MFARSSARATTRSFDLVNPADVLRRAYDDPRGVTRAFNLTLLVRRRGADPHRDLVEVQPAQVRALARASGFQEATHFQDPRRWFVDALWRVT